MGAPDVESQIVISDEGEHVIDDEQIYNMRTCPVAQLLQYDRDV